VAILLITVIGWILFLLKWFSTIDYTLKVWYFINDTNKKCFLFEIKEWGLWKKLWSSSKTSRKKWRK
jgi:hypothetical protein